MSSKTGIGTLAITWLERERTSDRRTKTVKQFSFGTSKVQLLVLPGYWKSPRKQTRLQLLLISCADIVQDTAANSVLSVKHGVDLGLSQEEPWAV